MHSFSREHVNILKIDDRRRSFRVTKDFQNGFKPSTPLNAFGPGASCPRRRPGWQAFCAARPPSELQGSAARAGGPRTSSALPTRLEVRMHRTQGAEWSHGPYVLSPGTKGRPDKQPPRAISPLRCRPTACIASRSWARAFSRTGGRTTWHTCR